jgi:hypothetical protein
MNLVHAGVDSTVIALWLGHESVEATQIYIHADMTIKERALARAAPPNTRPGRYRPPDALLAFLEGSDYAEHSGPVPIAPQRSRGHRGITRRSA